jgi:hypothetical protein
MPSQKLYSPADLFPALSNQAFDSRFLFVGFRSVILAAVFQGLWLGLSLSHRDMAADLTDVSEVEDL